MLCFSSSRWPLVVSIGTFGALPGPLWLWLSSGTGVMVLLRDLVISFSMGMTEKRGTGDTRSRHGDSFVANAPVARLATSLVQRMPPFSVFPRIVNSDHRLTMQASKTT